MIHCDVSLDRDVEHLRAEVIEEMGRVDILMNNAGVAVLGPPETIPTPRTGTGSSRSTSSGRSAACARSCPT